LKRILLVSTSILAFASPSAVALPKWTTGPKIGVQTSRSVTKVVAVRTSTTKGMDRLVFQFRSGRPGYRVRYVTQVLQDASGLPIPLKGSHFLSISFSPSGASGVTTNLSTAFPVLRQVASAGDFERVVSYGAGLASQRPFRVFTLKSPSRVVIDIAH
jgi:hypothetical protein